jgi:hypothetical protein
MRELYTSQDRALVYELKAAVESDGIACRVENEALAGVAGGVPPGEAWLQLWVVDDAHFDRAAAILKELLEGEAAAEETWECPDCGETLQNQFTECWRCAPAAAASEGLESASAHALMGIGIFCMVASLSFMSASSAPGKMASLALCAVADICLLCAATRGDAWVRVVSVPFMLPTIVVLMNVIACVRVATGG